MGIEKRVRFQILTGGLIWVALLFSSIETGIQRQLAWVVLLAVLVIFPLGLSLANNFSSLPAIPYQVALFLHPFAAGIVAISYFLPKGILAVSFAIVLLPFTFFAAWIGILRVQKQGWRAILKTPSEICFAFAPLYLPVGAFWLLMARLGMEPLGFTEPIVSLTAIHFHFAGFAAPVLCGLVGREILYPAPSNVDFRKSRETSFPSPKPLSAAGKAYWLITGIVISGPALVAVGITFSPLIEAIVGAILALGYTGLALLTLGHLRVVQGTLARVLLGISSLSAMVTMVAAAGFALRTFDLFPFLSIPQMVVVHGWGNAIGFVLCGFMGWMLNQKSAIQ